MEEFDNPSIKYKNRYKHLKRQVETNLIERIKKSVKEAQSKRFRRADTKIDTLNFSFGDIPKIKARNFTEKLTVINKKYKRDLTVDIPTDECHDCKLPKHMCILEKTNDQQYLDRFFYVLEQVYQANTTHKTFTYQADKHRVFLFDSLSVFDTISTANYLNPELAQFFTNYIADAFNILDMNDNDLESLLTKSKLVIARYDNLTGLHSHIDKIGRADGPVLTMSLGPSENVYDLIPIKGEQFDSLRITIKEGQYVLMDGLSRFLWFHGLPFGYEYQKSDIKYSLILLTNKFRVIESIWSNFWGTKIDVTAKPCYDKKTNKQTDENSKI